MTQRLLFIFSLPLFACGGSSEGDGELTLQDADPAPKNLHTLKTCRAEVARNVKAIKKAEVMYDAARDQFLAIDAHPTGPLPGVTAQSWGNGNAGFKEIGWKARGEIRGLYSVSTTRPSASTPGGDFEVTGRIDCDGDGVPAVYTATKSMNPTAITDEDVY